MQGRQNAANSERKGPHKSMHCKFCKPPGVVTPEKPTRPQLETKTRIHLVHEAADLRICDVHDEPGVPLVEAEACLCVLEGENPCPKCVPDKNRAAQKKKTCRCPKGAKPNSKLNDGAAPKKKKPEDTDDEFWWEKYSREHDAIARETWAAYLAQRKKDKKLAKCQKLEQERLMAKKNKECPVWYQKLSCQQMIYVEFLSTAIRLDSDENITDRTFFVLGGLGLYPRPNRKILKKCLRYCHYNSIQFLNQLFILTRGEDFFNEKTSHSSLKLVSTLYTWNERLIMNAICHLEFPMLLRELIDRLPELPRETVLPQIPYPVFPKLPKKKYKNPYEEPIWFDHVNWVERMKIDRINRCRAHMDTKRVKMPFLALVKRPSLIDARPPFLSQIEANEQTSWRKQIKEEKKSIRRNPVSTFNSSIDLTAVAGIEASEISTTDKADTEDICVFLRQPSKEPELVDEDEQGQEKEVKFEQEPEVLLTQLDRIKPFLEAGELNESEENDIPFKTPPKTESGVTIEQQCIPPKSSPGPPAIHYDYGKRELDVINEEICRFYPFVSTSTLDTNLKTQVDTDEITLQLKNAAEKLKQYEEVEPELEPYPKDEKIVKKNKKLKKKVKCISKKKESTKRQSKRRMGTKKSGLSNVKKRPKEDIAEDKGDVKEKKAMADDESDIEPQNSEDVTMEEDLLLNFSNVVKKEKKLSRKESIISDPDPCYDDDWTMKRLCPRNAKEGAEKLVKKRKKKNKRGKKIGRDKRKKSHEKRENDKTIPTEDANENVEMAEKMETSEKLDKETMTECYPDQYNQIHGRSKIRNETIEKGLVDSEARFEGKIEFLLQTIIQDLAEEGFVSATYQGVDRHPDIEQLIQHLRGEIITKQKREDLYLVTKMKWAKMNELKKFSIMELGISSRKAKLATWKDKKWICDLAKTKKDEFYFKIASVKADRGREIYKTLFQNYFGTGRYLKIFYAYMLPKYEEAILRGVF